MLIFVIIVLITSNYSHALNWVDLRAYAIKKSANLPIQELESRALKREAIQQGRWQNPQLMSQWGTLKAGNRNDPTAELSITQQIPLSNKFSLRRNLILNQMKLLETETNFLRTYVTHQAVLATWNLYVAQELYEHGNERAKRLALIKKYMQTRPRVSIKQRVELSVVSALLSRLEQVQDEKKYQLEVAKEEFNFWLGDEIQLKDLHMELPSVDKLVSEVNLEVEKTKDFLLGQLKVTASMTEREIAEKERRPDLFLGAGYRKEDVVPANNFSYVIVGLNIPLWDTGLNKVEAAKAREMKDQKNMILTQRRLSLEHHKAENLLKYSIEQIKRFPPSTVKAYEFALKEAEEGFQQGLIDVNTFLEAETQSHEVIDQVFISWISYLEKLSDLQLMHGEELNWERKL